MEIQVATPLGPFTVTVEAAHESTSHVSGVGYVTRIAPQVKISGTVKVRGIAYTVHRRHFWTDTPRPVCINDPTLNYAVIETDETTRWGRNLNDNGFKRVNTGKKVDVFTATYDRLSEAVDAVLKAIETSEQDWRTESLRMRLAAQIKAATDEVEAFRAQATEAYQRAEAHRAELAKLDGANSVCERCGTAVDESHFDPDAGLCDNCTDNNASRVIL